MLRSRLLSCKLSDFGWDEDTCFDLGKAEVRSPVLLISHTQALRPQCPEKVYCVEGNLHRCKTPCDNRCSSTSSEQLSVLLSIMHSAVQHTSPRQSTAVHSSAGTPQLELYEELHCPPRHTIWSLTANVFMPTGADESCAAVSAAGMH